MAFCNVFDKAYIFCTLRVGNEQDLGLGIYLNFSKSEADHVIELLT
jgi:hypothetical protein